MGYESMEGAAERTAEQIAKVLGDAFKERS